MVIVSARDICAEELREKGTRAGLTEEAGEPLTLQCKYKVVPQNSCIQVLLKYLESDGYRFYRSP